MALRRILTYPDTVLREQAEPVVNIDGKVQQLIDDMADTMYHAAGIGLASNQVGERCRIIKFCQSQYPRNLATSQHRFLAILQCISLLSARSDPLGCV